jgi:ATP-dependent Clp protease ATP-binding subunit ClpA
VPTIELAGTPLPSQRAAEAGSAVDLHDRSASQAQSTPLDDTAETLPDTAITLADEFSKRAEVLLLAQQSHQQDLQARLDRMKADFNAAQEERSEQMREMNALRDMAVEQAKKDDEILKKYIAMI